MVQKIDFPQVLFLCQLNVFWQLASLVNLDVCQAIWFRVGLLAGGFWRGLFRMCNQILVHLSPIQHGPMCFAKVWFFRNPVITTWDGAKTLQIFMVCFNLSIGARRISEQSTVSTHYPFVSQHPQFQRRSIAPSSMTYWWRLVPSLLSFCICVWLGIDGKIQAKRRKRNGGGLQWSHKPIAAECLV